MTMGVTRDDEHGPVELGAGQESLAPAQRIGVYRLIQPLGEGGMGVVYLALDQNGRAVAIKVLREHIAQDRDARERLRREVETLARVRDARVAAVLDADTEGPQPYIVTRYIPGPALDAVVSESGPLRGEALLRLGRGLWDALNAIHRAGVIHRDLKPANVVLLDGDPVVIDFGIAHVADDIRLTMTGLVMGTPGYLSPEVVEGAPVTEATDWWGWAATIAFAASGVPPFGRGPMHVVLDRVRRGQPDLRGVDPRLVPLLQAALSPVPAQRPHADEIVRAIDRYAAASPPTTAIPVAGPPSTVEYPGMSFTQAQPQAQEIDAVPVDEPDPGASGSSRLGTMIALLVGVLGIAAIWPVVAIGLVVLWSLLARFVDRASMSVLTRRHLHGRRRRDVPLAVLVSPWHAVVAVVASAIALVIPAIVAVGSAFSIALVSAAVAGGDPYPGRSAPLVVGAILALLMCWLGPGSASLRRGSRTLLDAMVPGRGATDFVVGTFVLIGVGLGAWAWVRNGQPDWWPWSASYLSTLSRSFW